MLEKESDGDGEGAGKGGGATDEVDDEDESMSDGATMREVGRQKRERNMNKCLLDSFLFIFFIW